jgi:general secretion pathway protein A
MYRKHFGFTHFPFDCELAPEALFSSGTIIEAEARLKHLLELRAIGLITADVGSGKTTVCRKVASALHPGLYRVFYVPLSTGNVMDMYKSIAWELGLPTERNRAAAYRVIRTEITRLTREAKQRPLVIVDEAHHLRNDVLEDLRLLYPLRDGLGKPPVPAASGLDRAAPTPRHGSARIHRKPYRGALSPQRPLP